MKHYLLLAGLFTFALSAAAQTFGSKPTVTNQVVNPTTKIDKLSILPGDMSRTINTKMDAKRTDLLKPSRSIVIRNERWLNTKAEMKDANGAYMQTREREYTNFGKLKKQTTNFYKDGVLAGIQVYTYEYDDRHNNTKETLSQAIALPNTFATVQVKEWGYNDQNLCTSAQMFEYDFRNDNSILSGVKYNYGYDNSGNNTKEECFYYEDENWIPIYRDEWGWDGNYQYMNLSLSGWDNASKKWTKGIKNINELIRNGKTSVSGDYKWDADKQQWSVINEFISTYDNYGNQTMYSEQKQTSDGYEGYRGTDERISAEYGTYNHYVWDNNTNGWVKDWYRNIQYDENGNTANATTYNADDSFDNKVEYTWQKFFIGNTEFPDCYFMSDANTWTFDKNNIGKDMGNGIVVWNDLTIKKGQEFKFASEDWTTFNWGCKLDEYIPFDQPVQLTYNGANISITMEADEITFKTVSLNVLAGVVAFETYPTSIDSPDAQRLNIYASNGKIVVQNAKSVKVYSASGELISTTSVTPVQKGLYIVKADGKTVKLNVN